MAIFVSLHLGGPMIMKDKNVLVGVANWMISCGGGDPGRFFSHFSEKFMIFFREFVFFRFSGNFPTFFVFFFHF